MGELATFDKGVAATTTIAILTPLLFLIFTNSSRGLRIVFPLYLLGATSWAWTNIVTSKVPDPYLDEVFHVPQAQKYCQGKFREWDDKITTPPGLYLFSVLLQRTAAAIRLPWLFLCDAGSLRVTNVLGLLVLVCLALRCRHELESRHETRPAKQVSAYAIHSAINIGLFPLIFFFSGLYYTDVISTAVVVGTYLNHLKRVHIANRSLLNDLLTIILGIATLIMRQTNIFWVVVYLGGLEAVHAIKTLRPPRAEQPTMASVWEHAKFCVWRYSVGDVHDLPLDRAWPDALSIGIAALCNPIRVLRQVWPYVTVLAAFAAFVGWNGGVVLGDKSNHVATIHLAQLLYIGPFFAFFSAPLLVPYAVSAVDALLSLGQSKGNGAAKTSTVQKKEKTPAAATSPTLRLLTEYLFAIKVVVWLVYLAATVLVSLAIVRYNTIIHPFTLADNRHYMFYIFRYTIRRGSLMRLLLVAPYTLTRWMVYGALAGCMHWQIRKPTGAAAFSNHPLVRNSTPKSAEIESLPEATNTSTGLIFVLATALSLMTAPLVEPRYYIIPWVMWRLLVPAWQIQQSPSVNKILDGCRRVPVLGAISNFCRRYDARLILETAWFIVINATTCYIFLAKPYTWKNANGTILDEGRLQRFMW